MGQNNNGTAEAQTAAHSPEYLTMPGEERSFRTVSTAKELRTAGCAGTAIHQCASQICVIFHAGGTIQSGAIGHIGSVAGNGVIHQN